MQFKIKNTQKVTIIFNNVEGYDGHIIFKELNNFDNIDIQVIPKTSEKYMSIIVNRNIVFLDIVFLLFTKCLECI